MVAGMIVKASQELQQDLSDHVLFAYGGNGGLFACGVAHRAGIRTTYLFDLGPVFSAFGSSVSDICHVYERSFHLLLRDGAEVTPLNQVLEEMRNQGVRDLLGEGITPENTECSVELEVSRAGDTTRCIKCPQLRFGSGAELRRVLTPDLPEDNATVELVRVRVKKAISKPALVMKEKGDHDASAAQLGMRRVMQGSGQQEATLYRWELLRPGHVLPGGSILEAANSTYLVPPGWNLEMDHYGNALIRCGTS
jgi:acetophenone carboxylase